MLEKLTRNRLPERARIDVIRHRVQSRLAGRGRSLLLVTAAVALAGSGTLAANVAVADREPAPPPAATAGLGDQPALADREADADRADRSERPEVDEPGTPKAVAPQVSPEPEPSPTEAEAESDAGAAEPEPEPAQAAQDSDPDWVHPIPGATTTSCFGRRWGAMHAGVDLAAPHGTPIRAVGAGTVTDAGWVFSGYGISVVINHHNGVYTHYAHASQADVSPGQRVSPGETIAREGSTGDSTGPHLHFEVHQGMWNQIEPTAWLRDRGVDIGGC